MWLPHCDHRETRLGVKVELQRPSELGHYQRMQHNIHYGTLNKEY